MRDSKYVMYEILYKRAWDKQNKIDRKLKPSLVPSKQTIAGRRGALRSKELGRVGGRPRKDGSCGTGRSVI